MTSDVFILCGHTVVAILSDSPAPMNVNTSNTLQNSENPVREAAILEFRDFLELCKTTLACSGNLPQGD